MRQSLAARSPRVVRAVALGATLAGAVALAGCPKRAETTPEARAREVFDGTCSTCHGTDGRGDGPAARALAVRPRNYTDAAWQSSVTDEQIRAIVVKGGAAVGKSALMPASPAFADDPKMLDALVAIIRGFGAAR